MSDQSTTTPDPGTEEVNRDVFGIETEETPPVEQQTPEQELAADLTRAFEEREQRSVGGPGKAGGEAPSPPAEPPSTQEEEGEPDPAPVAEVEPPPVTETDPPPATQVEPPPVTSIPAAGPELDLAAEYRKVYGRLPTQAELDAQFQFQQDIARLAREDPARLAEMEALLYGQAQQQVQQEQRPAGTPPPGGTEDPPDPYIEEHVAPLREELGAMRGYLEQQEQARVQEYQRQIAEQVVAGTAKFTDEFGLTEAESSALENAVVQSGIFPGLFSAHGTGDAAMYQAMSQVYWSTPEYRQREIDKAASAQAVQTAESSQRKAKAGAVAGNSGNVPRDEPVPTTKQGRLAAMATEIATAQSQGG